MLRVAVVCLLFAPTGVSAQAPVRFQFAPGRGPTYTVEQLTTVTETTLEEGTQKLVPAATVTRLNLTRRWDVTAVDPAGVATLDMVITVMKQTISRPGPRDRDGKPTVDRVVMDSATPEGQQQMAAFLDKPVVTVRLDPAGNLIDAKSASAASAERLRAELPFRVVFPAAPVPVGARWMREFTVKLDPPLGTGETHAATQTYTRRPDASGKTVVGIATALKAEPKDAADRVPLVPLLWEGEAYFDAAAGRYAGAKLSVKREVAGHAGPGTAFTYESTYTETPAGK